MRGHVALVTAVILAAACGAAQPSTPPQPTHAHSPADTAVASHAHGTTPAGPTDLPLPTNQPLPTEQPLPTDQPSAGATPDSAATPAPTAEPQPLPEPEFSTAEEITAVMYERAQAENVVVSMLRLLGIGLYAADGSVIRQGSESSDADYYVFEEEARGLAELLKQFDLEDRWVPFADFHNALVHRGFHGTAEQLAAAYNDAYEANPEAPIAQLVYGLGGISVDAPLHPLAPWLLFVDGFVPPHGSDQAVAMVGEIAQADARWGVAREGVQQYIHVPFEVDPLVIAHLMSVVHSASVRVEALPAKTHEGHGGPGQPSTVSATVQAVASSFVSPFSGRPLIPLVPNAGAGLPVTWQPADALNTHGAAPMPASTVTDPLGRATFTFTPRQEAANGEGYLTTEVAILHASVSGEQLITQLYGLPSLGALVGNRIHGVGTLEVEWHEPEAMRIALVNRYNVTLDLILGSANGTGTDSFEGILALQEDGTWRGVVNGSAIGTYRGTALGNPCTSSWSATQQVEVIGAPAPHALDGDFYFRFLPVTPPAGSLGSGPCAPSSPRYQGIDYAPYNDVRITSGPQDQGLVIILPQKPGGTRDYPVSLPGVVDANWHVQIEFLEPAT